MKRKQTRLARELRTLQFLNVGLRIAKADGILNLSCNSVARATRVHPNLVRLYIGRSTILCRRVARIAQERGEHAVFIDAQQHGLAE